MNHPARHPTTSEIGPTDEPILVALARYTYLVPLQLQRLLYSQNPSGPKYAQERLRRLVDVGCLQRRALPRPSRTGTAPYVYALTRTGLQHLRAQGIDVDPRPVEMRPHNYVYLSHALAVSDVLIALDLLARLRGDIQVAGLLNERQLKARPIFVRLPEQPQLKVIPDAWVDVHISEGERRFRYTYCLELDRGTTEQKAWRRKVAALVAYAEADGPYEQAFATVLSAIPVVATPGEARRIELLRWTEAELRSLGREDQADLFRFSGASPATDPVQFFLGAHWSQPFAPQPGPLLLVGEAGQ